MQKRVLFLLLFFSTIVIVGQKTWEKTTTHIDDKVVFVKSHMPLQYQLFKLDIADLKADLQTTAKRGKNLLSKSNTIISFPNKKGKIQQFKILESSIMEDELAAQFPMIRTYIGQGVDDPTATLRLSLGTDGLHAMIFAANKATLFIDPYTKSRNKYIIYTSDKLPNLNEFTCKVEDKGSLQTKTTTNHLKTNAADGKLRTYRLAVACTIEYSAYHLNNQGVSSGAPLATKKAAVLSAITNTINRVTGIYEKETAVTFKLVANETDLIFIDSDNFTNNDQYALIDESQTVITSIIGTANFDIGHTFGTGGNGLATVGAICETDLKARGVTGLPNPIGDLYDVDYVAHEMGHQFGANHTFNFCDGNGRHHDTAAEPGSGSTIMAYANLCSGVNVQDHTDAYFHAFSLEQIFAKITSSPICAVLTDTGNHAPTADAGVDYTIPKGTAYILKGAGTDQDADTLTYCWEQIDVELATYPLVSTATTGPAYRSLIPTTSPNRYMPAFSTVFSGSLASDWEITPTVGRILNFRLTTRDNRADGGQSNFDNKILHVSNDAGPFVVTSQTVLETWAVGESETITWDVAGTNTNEINTNKVEILLVDNKGNTLVTLAENTDNDGSEIITVPNTGANSSKVMVRAIDNIFYAISSATVNIIAPPSCTSLTSPVDGETNVSISSKLSWTAVDTATGYKIRIGTTAGGTNIEDNTDLNNVTTYTPEINWAEGQKHYVTIIAYNDAGNATSCVETTFVTEIIVNVDTLDDVFACDSYTLQSLINGNYFTEPNGQGTPLNAGDIIETSQTIYIYASEGISYAESEFHVTINRTPKVDSLDNIILKNNIYVLPSLLEGNYFTEPFGEGTPLYARDKISETQILYIYAETGEVPNICFDQSSFVVTVSVQYMQFFTPNGDQEDDFWQFSNSAIFPGSQINIFDKSGKLVAQIDPNGIGWDGTSNGRPLRPSDYWFNVQLIDGSVLKGNFSLLR